MLPPLGLGLQKPARGRFVEHGKDSDEECAVCESHYPVCDR